MPKDLIIVGASGHGKVVADIARQMMENGRQKYETIRFLDDDAAKRVCGHYPVIGTLKDMEKYLEADFFIAIGDAKIREKVVERLESLNAEVSSLVHPMAVVGENVSVGKGTVVVGGAVINAGARIGKYCIINTGATVDHDCVIGDFVHIAPGAHICGGVQIGEKTWIGAGATVVQELGVCAHCVIGAGAVAIHNLNEAGVYMGIPAKTVRTTQC